MTPLVQRLSPVFNRNGGVVRRSLLGAMLIAGILGALATPGASAAGTAKAPAKSAKHAAVKRAAVVTAAAHGSRRNRSAGHRAFALTAHAAPPQCATPALGPGKAQRGLAAYYGTGAFAWANTASGEPLDPGKLTAAHRSLPFGSEADVVNLRNGRVTRVRITDRGPYSKGVVIDLSPRAAAELDMLSAGRDPVEVRPVAPTQQASR